LDHIDAMRPVKQAAVISTHALLFFAPAVTSTAVIGLIMLTRFSRDAFLFVSACMLTYSYRDSQGIDLGHYSKRRFLSVGVPYLAWTVIYFFYTSMVNVHGFPYYSFHAAAIFSASGLHTFWDYLTSGYYHLYYLIVIMEFYVLFPLLMRFVRRFQNWHVTILIIAVVWQIAFGVLVSPHFPGFAISQYVQTRLITSYIVYIIGGMILALHLDQVHDWIRAKARWIVAGTLASAAVAEILAYFTSHGSLPGFLQTGTNVFSPAVLPYNVGAILCVYLVGVHLVAPRRHQRTRAIVQSSSDNSYGVYLSQMLWIPILVRLRDSLGWHVSWEVAAPIALVLVYFIGYYFTELMAHTPLARALTGRNRVRWSPQRPERYESSPEDHDATVSPLEVLAD
jgi:peptidoglycan/LPS O-acetylase OafA/YrhL